MKLVESISNVLMIIGFTLIVGTVGATDTGIQMSNLEFWLKSIIGILMIVQRKFLEEI